MGQGPARRHRIDFVFILNLNFFSLLVTKLLSVTVDTLEDRSEPASFSFRIFRIVVFNARDILQTSLAKERKKVR